MLSQLPAFVSTPQVIQGWYLLPRHYQNCFWWISKGALPVLTFLDLQQHSTQLIFIEFFYFHSIKNALWICVYYSIFNINKKDCHDFVSIDITPSGSLCIQRHPCSPGSNQPCVLFSGVHQVLPQLRLFRDVYFT